VFADPALVSETNNNADGKTEKKTRKIARHNA
jgi:hypothetical protein